MSQPTLRIHDFIVTGTDNDELHHLKSEIFTSDSYYFETENPEPYILDLGAHIGMASLYFHRQYPGSHLVAVEPEPHTFSLLAENLSSNRVPNYQLVNAAIVPIKTSEYVDFHIDPEETWLSSGSLLPGSWTSFQPTTKIQVNALLFTDLFSKEYLPENKSWDLIKMDIEGAEKDILLKAGQELHRVKRLIVEAHNWSAQDEKQIIQHLAQYGLTFKNKQYYAKQSSKLALYEFSNQKERP